MVDLPPAATKQRTSADRLFDHLVGTTEQRRWHVQSECLSSLEVDNQFVPGGSLDRQVGRLLALEDAINIRSGGPTLIDQIRPVGKQAADADEKFYVVDGWTTVSGCSHHD